MSSSRDQITEAVLAFVNAQSWAESKQIVEAHSSALLTDDADEFMAHLLAQNGADEDIIRTLEEHRALLLRCRHEGIEAAFADLVAPGDPSTAAPESIVETVLAFVNAQTWAESKQIVERRREVLLTDTADEVLANLLAQYKEDENATRILEEHRALLARCRREGIEAAFADRLSPLSVVEAVRAFITADTWAESKQIIEAHRDVLLTDAADEVLADLLAEDWDNQEASRLVVEEHRALLARCCREGIDAAFADRLRPSMTPHRGELGSPAVSPSREELMEVVGAIITADTPAESCQIIETKRDLLLTDAADKLLTEILAQIRADEHTRNTLEESWAALQAQLGVSLAQNPLENRAESLERAIYHYQRSLEVYTQEDFPEQWAATQNNLASAYYGDRIRGERAENLEKAIHYYKLALEVYTQEDFPTEWATIQNSLAGAYLGRIQGERAENIEQSIHHFQQALEVRIRQDSPERSAAVQNNLATAYRDRIRGERAENLEKAIHYYKLALEVYTQEDFPTEWATIQNSLAATYLRRIQGEPAQNLKEAIRHYKQVLEVHTRQDFFL